MFPEMVTVFVPEWSSTGISMVRTISHPLGCPSFPYPERGGATTILRSLTRSRKGG